MATIGGRRDGARVPPGRNQRLYGIFADVRTEDSNCVDAAKGYQQASVGQPRKAVGIESLAETGCGERGRQLEARLGDHPSAFRVYERDTIGIVFGGDETVSLTIDEQRRWFADRLHALRHAQLRLSDHEFDKLPVPRCRDPSARRT